MKLILQPRRRLCFFFLWDWASLIMATLKGQRPLWVGVGHELVPVVMGIGRVLLLTGIDPGSLFVQLGP